MAQTLRVIDLQGATLCYTSPMGKTLTFPARALIEEEGAAMAFYLRALAHGGGYECAFSDDEAGQAIHTALKVELLKGEQPKTYTFFIDLDELPHLVPIPQNVEPDEASVLNGAEAFALGGFECFQDPDYFEALHMEAWGVAKRSFSFAVSWEEKGVTQTAPGHVWDELTCPDGSVFYVVHGQGPMLHLPPYLEAQRAAQAAAFATPMQTQRVN